MGELRLYRRGAWRWALRIIRQPVSRKEHFGGKAFQAVGTACGNALGQDCVWLVGGTAGKLMWLERSERGRETEEVRAGRGWGQVAQGLVGLLGLREDFGFYPEGGGSPGGLWGGKAWI